MTDNPEKATADNENTSEEELPNETSETPEGDESIDSEARAIVKNYCVASAAIGFIPVPLVDLVALTGVQLKMLHTLARVYDVPFKSSWGRSAIGSLVGGSTPLLASRGTISMLKTVPGIGTGLAMIAQPTLSSACTYAVGKVFIQHFSSGGTFLTFSPARVREYFSQLFSEKAATEAQ